MDLSGDPSSLPHDSRGHVVIITGAVTNLLAIVAVCARLYTRAFITSQLGVDDWLAVASLVWVQDIRNWGAQWWAWDI
jgi:hypothetical protein